MAVLEEWHLKKRKNFKDLLNKIQAPFQILFHTVRGDLINGKHRNFILVNQAPKGVPRSVKLYGSNSIQDILKGLDKAEPLAVDDWQLIEKIISNAS